MLLSDVDIKTGIHDARIGIQPYDEEMIQPASIDIRLGNEFVHYSTGWQYTSDSGVLDPDQDNSHLIIREVIPDGGSIIIHPNEFLLGHTMEEVALSSRIAARLEGRSSFGRLGLIIHSTAGFIDPGFKGQITLELSNISPNPIKLRPGMRVGQISFVALVSPAMVPYGSRAGSKYQGQTGATASRSQMDAINR